MTGWLKLTEPSGVAEARRRARALATRLGIASVRVEHVAIVATEIAQNVLRHGGGGRMLIDCFGAPGLERLHVIGIDDGPGVARIDKVLRDGVSTKSSPGTGLGAMKRLSDRLDIHTAPGQGLVVSAEFRVTTAHADFTDHAGLLIPYPGERACGDAVAARDGHACAHYMVCDGLGHGAKAARAADMARAAFMDARAGSLEAMLEEIDDALVGSRGAVVALVRLDRARGRMDYAAIGNIATVVVRGTAAKRLSVRDGLLGGAHARPHVESFDVGPEALVIMHSDGVSTLRGLEQRSALLRRSAPVVAARLLHESIRGHDDASMLVARMAPAHTI